MEQVIPIRRIKGESHSGRMVYKRLFHCEACDNNVFRDISNGKKYNSCGCVTYINRDQKGTKNPNYKHGQNGTRLFNIWAGIINRCNNSNDKAYKYYGGKGIKVCEEWQSNFVIFKLWAEQSEYEEGLTIDRVDNDGNYEPNNCRWITKSENTIKSNNERWKNI